MIYTFPGPDEPIRQGDIFVSLPRVEVSLARLTILDEDDSAVNLPWQDILEAGKSVSAVLPVRPVAAIVASQDCDCVRSDDITLCEIRDFRDVEKKAAQTERPSKWARILTQHARLNLKWFYLPPCPGMGFTDKLAVDFTISIRVRRVELEDALRLRKGRLNDVADEHFRERISEFFRRYPYDEWYPLNPEELAAYQQKHPDAEPYGWQNGAQGNGSLPASSPLSLASAEREVPPKVQNASPFQA